jgi:hypothetical protein
MGAITDLWKSERGLLAVLIIIAASVLAGLDKMPVADWQTFVTGIFITYAAGKTVTGAVQLLTSPRAELAAAVKAVVVAAEQTPAPAPEVKS